MIFYIEGINSRASGRGSVATGQNNPYKKKVAQHKTVIIVKSVKPSSTPPQIYSDILYLEN